ncbi:hypothetical protein SDC9_74839 [bioreactor metagenome]|uniref:HTH cro/C1-type domain-containing protein n=1 Tax=bioreactor metagenome TaxID=1076179 RepID=A0A644YJY6_9ZZZZ
METFGERFKQLRKEKGLTQDKLGEIFFLNKSSISKYENNNNVPEIEALQAFADYFGVSVDYLLGRTDYKNIWDEFDANIDNNKLRKEIEKIESNADSVDLIVAGLRNLNQESRDLINNFVTMLSKNQKYLDDRDYELLKTSINNLLETITIKNKLT